MENLFTSKSEEANQKENQNPNFDQIFFKYLKDPNEYIRNILILNFQPLIGKICKSFTDQLKYANCEYEDLIQEGTLIFIYILNKNGYKKEKGGSPTTFFYKGVYNGIQSFLNKNSTPFQLDDYKMAKIKKVSQYHKDIQEGISPLKALKKNKINGKDVIKYSPIMFKSINDVVYDNDGDEVEYGNLIPSKENIEKEVMHQLTMENLYKELKNLLNELDYQILIERYIKEYDIDKICEIHNSNKQNIYNSLIKSLKLLRKSLKKEDFYRD